MLISFPHMGSQLFYKKLLDLFELKYIMPPAPTQKTIDLGVKYSPEFACYPYKILLGTYIEAIELGADTILTSGGSGPCRAGLYAPLHQKTLKKMGYEVDFIVFDDFSRSPKEFINNIQKLKGARTWVDVFKNCYTAYKLASSVDKLQQFVEKNRAYEIETGAFNKTFANIMKDFDNNANTVSEIKSLYKKGLNTLCSIPVKNLAKDNDRIKIGIVGEIYVVMEPSVNMNIVEVLNKLGCEVSTSLYISEWIKHAVIPPVFKKSSGQHLLDNSKKYLKIQIGGHESHNIGNIIEYKKQGYDGIIHLMPFGCLPELITQTLAPKITEDINIPILTLSLDEQTGIANNQTRIEAFVEMLHKNKGASND